MPFARLYDVSLPPKEERKLVDSIIESLKKDSWHFEYCTLDYKNISIWLENKNYADMNITIHNTEYIIGFWNARRLRKAVNILKKQEFLKLNSSL